MKAVRIALGTLAAIVAAPSKAVVTLLIVTGIVTDGRICSSFSNCTDLTGQSYSITYTVDDSVGTRSTAPGFDALRGGTSISMSPPTPVTATASIAGQTYVSTGEYWGLAQTANGNVQNQQNYRAREETIVDGSIVHTHFNEFAANLIYASSSNNAMILAPINGLNSSLSLGQIFYYNYDRDTGTGAFTNYLYLLANGNLTSAQFGSSASEGAVPEPSTWMLLIVGFGLGSMAMRRIPLIRTRQRRKSHSAS